MNKEQNIVIIGAGVAGVHAALKLIDLGIEGNKITFIDKGKNPYERKPEEVMEGFMGAGAWSDGKYTYHHEIGGQLSKYCGEDKAYELYDQVKGYLRKYHPNPHLIQISDPTEEPDFIKPYFNLRLFPVEHIGTENLHDMAKNIYGYLIEKGINFIWNHQVHNIDFRVKDISYHLINKMNNNVINFDKLIFCVGKSGIDFSQKLINKYKLKTEPKSVQIGVRFESEQKYFQKLIDVSYDFKLYQKPSDTVSIRSFCTNNNAAYVAVEETYGDISYNGHAKKDPKYVNGKTNFGIIMEIKDIPNPFEWARDKVSKLQTKNWISKSTNEWYKSGLYYSPDWDREPSLSSEGIQVKAGGAPVDNLELFNEVLGEYAQYILNFITDLGKVFPEMGNNWGIYVPEVKYLSPEPLVNYNDLSLSEYPDIYFAGDALSARGITCSAAQGIYIAEGIMGVK